METLGQLKPASTINTLADGKAVGIAAYANDPKAKHLSSTGYRLHKCGVYLQVGQPMKTRGLPEQSTTDALNTLIKKYRAERRPIEVNFRALVPWIPYSSDRYTHLIHHYPAKLIPQIPHFFINNEILSGRKDTILDPFCGTGTVMLEAILSSRHALGADSNPLARLIAQVKCTPLNWGLAEQWSAGLSESYKNTQHVTVPPVVNLDYWFSERITDELGRLLTVLSAVDDHDLRNLAMVSFSHLLREVSFADPRVSVPVRLNPKRFDRSHFLHKKSTARLRALETVPVLEKFKAVFDENLSRLKRLSQRIELGTLKGISADARNLKLDATSRRIRSSSIQLAVTSPPYLGAQKYVRASSLSLGWLNLVEPEDLVKAEATSIGREHFPKSEYEFMQKTGIKGADNLLIQVFKKYPLRAKIASTYLLEMKESLEESYRVIKTGGYLVLVAGANRLCGEDFNTPAYLSQIAKSIGFVPKLVMIDTIHSRGLMTKRNRTAGLIPQEWVFLLERQ